MALATTMSCEYCSSRIDPAAGKCVSCGAAASHEVLAALADRHAAARRRTMGLAVAAVLIVAGGAYGVWAYLHAPIVAKVRPAHALPDELQVHRCVDRVEEHDRLVGCLLTNNGDVALESVQLSARILDEEGRVVRITDRVVPSHIDGVFLAPGESVAFELIGFYQTEAWWLPGTPGYEGELEFLAEEVRWGAAKSRVMETPLEVQPSPELGVDSVEGVLEHFVVAEPTAQGEDVNFAFSVRNPGTEPVTAVRYAVQARAADGHVVGDRMFTVADERDGGHEVAPTLEAGESRVVVGTIGTQGGAGATTWTVEMIELALR